jgi:hypothetical protein
MPFTTPGLAQPNEPTRNTQVSFSSAQGAPGSLGESQGVFGGLILLSRLRRLEAPNTTNPV